MSRTGTAWTLSTGDGLARRWALAGAPGAGLGIAVPLLTASGRGFIYGFLCL